MYSMYTSVPGTRAFLRTNSELVQCVQNVTALGSCPVLSTKKRSSVIAPFLSYATIF